MRGQSWTFSDRLAKLRCIGPRIKVQVRLVVRLLAAGAKTDIADTRYRATPLGWAQHGLTNRLTGSSSGHAEVIALLERAGRRGTVEPA